MTKSHYYAACCLLGLSQSVAHAQDFPADQPAAPVEEIVVSGFRPTTVQELDTSISLLDAKTIEQASVANFEELIQIIPNMNLSGEGSRARYLQLRGVGEREQYEGAPNPSVGFIIDDIDLSGIGGIATTFDLEQIEVLRGPQSARYGSSALAGVVYMQSALPTGEFTGKAEVTGGNEDIFSAGVAVGGGINDFTQGRFSVFKYEDNGFRNNEYLGRDDTNGRDELTVRGRLNFNLSSDWNLLLSGLYADFDNGYDAWALTEGDTSYDPSKFATTRSDKPGRDVQETTAASMKISGPLTQGMEFVSITSLASTDVEFAFDGDWGNDPYWNTRDATLLSYDYNYQNNRERASATQEFRLLSSENGRIFNATTDWVVGLYAESLDEDNDIVSVGNYEDSWGVATTDRTIASEFDSSTLAVFGGIDSDLTDRLTLSVGLRYEYWTAEYNDAWVDNSSPALPNPPNNRTCDEPTIDCKPADNLVGGHVALSYAWTDGLNTYLRAARGFKAGGFNPSLAAVQTSPDALGPEFVAYDPEYLCNYELGLKGLWADGAVQTDIAVFYMDRDDAQLSQSSQQVDGDPNSFVFVTYNGKANAYGLEASGIWQLSTGWELHGALGLLQSKIEDTASTQEVSPDAVGRELAHAPQYTLNLGATWTSQMGWYGRVDVNAIDQFYFDISHNQESESYEVVNLRIGKEWENWTVSAWGRNIFDESYATRGFYFKNEPPWDDTLYTRFGEPSTYGLTLGYNF
jgi:iron complex outermembrane receptor protein